jgi:hypothetical protein
MITAIINAIHPRGTGRTSTGRTGIDRARYTVSWYLNGTRPDAPGMTSRPGAGGARN